MAPHSENRISISRDLTSFQSNRKIFKSCRKSNHNVSNQIFTSQVELPKWFKLRFKSQSRLPITATQSGLMMLKIDAINQSINQSINTPLIPLCQSKFKTTRIKYSV